jgi:phosphoadenosine phosphosulfate reductase
MTEELTKKVNRAIKLIQSASKIAIENCCPELEVCYSGGKDSDVILELAKMANVPYRAIYKNTGIDPRGTIKHARENGVEVMPPKKKFIDLIAYHGLPSRRNRYCCQYLKEYKILDYAILGIRRDESVARKERYKEPEQCREYSKKSKVRQYFPILDWTKEDSS